MGAERGAAIATIAFVTGRLAEPALNETLRGMQGADPGFAYHVVALKITVAEGDKYVDGYVIARRLNIELPAAKIEWRGRTHRTKRN